MNLSLFNRMNLRESSSANKGMYAEWTSLSVSIQNYGDENKSVLEKFGLLTSREVTVAIVKQLTSNLGITHPPEASPLVTDKEVQWCMEVLCFGLSLPLSEHESIKDCVNVYCEWLTALLPSPKLCVPQPILDDSNIYCRKIISHFYYLFIPRKGDNVDTINRQAVLCHRVLRTLKHVAHDSKTLEKETWEALLLFLIAINDNLLALPTVKEDVADQLGERTLSVLFEVWLIACSDCFPSPILWKTLRECCMNWRHRTALIEQWNRVNLSLTARILTFMYGPNFPQLKLGDDDIISRPLSNDCTAQSWYRFLNILGNPVCLTKPEVISQTQKFLHFAINDSASMDPCQHPCLENLPQIFSKAIRGVAGQVDAFLGIAQPSWWEVIVSSDRNRESPFTSASSVHSPTPPSQRRLAKSFSVAPSSVVKGTSKTSLIGLTTSRTSSITSSIGPPSSTSNSLPSLNQPNSSESKSPLASGRPKCNSILHLFGEWLFDAAYIGADIDVADRTRRSSSLNYAPQQNETPSSLAIEKFEGGKAEALGALCRIICSKKTGEEILPCYLARFYLAVQRGLRSAPDKECTETMVAILMNSSNLFGLDLNGVRVLLPAFITALEAVLPEKDLKVPPNVSKVELRRACINILSSVLILPLHFQNVPIKESIASGHNGTVTFGQLKLRLMNLLMNALQIESDSQNTHMLLGGLFLSVLDSATFEDATEHNATGTVSADSSANANLLTSASDTASTASMASSTVEDRCSSAETVEVTPESFSHQLATDSAHALFVRATYLVCHRLISSWKTDLNISLAALELLSGLARIHINETDAIECKRAVKWLCDYIIQQCSRPPPAHSKDLHSTIVAAFHCCSVWLLQHPYLLRDKDCLRTVLEVVELGVSGTKSIGKPTENIKMKEEKELKPASIRVRDAAEHLLTVLLEDVGCFPDECGPESSSSLLDEVTLLRHCIPNNVAAADRDDAVRHFRYFVSESSVLLALLEDPLGNDQDPQPTVTVLIRGPFGRHAWTMQLRHLPRYKSAGGGVAGKSQTSNTGRPVTMLRETSPRPAFKQKYFPESVERVQQCRVDQSIPSLECVLSKESFICSDAEKLNHFLSSRLDPQCTTPPAGEDIAFQECVPPSVCHDYQTARLFLSHFGLLEIDKDTEAADGKIGLLELDGTANDFSRELTALDQLSSRTCDTVYIFYVKSGQTNAQDIVANVTEAGRSGLSPYFGEFLHSLGWIVEVGKHPGWTGNPSTSWKLPTSTSETQRTRCTKDSDDVAFDGSEHVLYWADACSEMAFIVPSKLKSSQVFGVASEESPFNANSLSWCDGNISDGAIGRDKRALSLDLDKQPVPPKRSSNRQNLLCQVNAKILVIWLENFEDQNKISIDELSACTHPGTNLEGTIPKNAETTVIFVHAMETGLFRVLLRGVTGRAGLALPLTNEIIVNRRCLGHLVRHTALNTARRKRLDSDNYQPPHVRRRVKIQEMVQKYRRNMTKPELLTNLFRTM